MRRKLQVLVLIFILFLVRDTDQCGTNNIQCFGNNTYKLCLTINNNPTPVGSLLTCASDLICTESIGNYACISQETYNEATETTNSSTQSATTDAETSTEPTTISSTASTTTLSSTISTTTVATTTYVPTSETTTPATVNPPDCKTTGKYPASLCYQYYECYKFLIFWIKLTLKSCSSGYFFDSATAACVPNNWCLH